MEFRDLKKQYLNNKDLFNKAILDTVETSAFISGPSVKKLEIELAEYVGVKHCITCANGTDALQLVLMAWGVGPGDAVFVPDFTFFATAEVVSLVGATPVFVDVDQNDYNIDCDHLESQIKGIIEKKELTPKAIIPVDLFGLPAKYHEIDDIAKKYNLMVLEDGAQGFGGSIKGKKACSFGDAATTSFFPAKPLGCYGDGGAIFTNDDSLAKLLNSLKVHGKGQTKYDNIRIGTNSRLDSIQASILSVKLKLFKEFELQRVNEVADLYRKLLKNLSNEIKYTIIDDDFISSYAQFTITLNDNKIREALKKFLAENNIPTMVYYIKPIHRQGAYTDLETIDSDFPNTNYLCDSVLSLPMHPYLEDEEVSYICDKIHMFFERK